MLRPAFHNAFGRLQPCRQAVGSCFLPSWRYWREAPLLALALEAKPALTEFACDGHAAAERRPAPLRRASTLRTLGESFTARRSCPTVSLSSLRGRRRYHPHLPALARRVEKRPITHRQVLRRCCAPRSELMFVALQGGCHKTHFRRQFYCFFAAQTYVVRFFAVTRVPEVPSVCHCRCGWTSVSFRPEA